MKLQPLQSISKFFDLFRERPNEPLINYYKQRGMSESEAITMANEHKMPSEPDEDAIGFNGNNIER